ncbi:MAG: class I tRNA ligase family protein, partial [Gaiellaceae bacterium]
MAPPVFQPLPTVPDHPALEEELLATWERESTFDALRDQNRGGPKFSFVDGPVTANRFSLGVHTAWGRTLKDVFQRYKALRGFDQRYQNGFDCQGLWIEVGVERELGLNSKREIEEYGLEEFARKCRDVVVRSSEALTRGSIRLGQWMDWGRDYFTFSDTNIEYIWKFLKIVHGRGWLYMGHRATEWCPRCGTSISQHELAMSGVYQDKADPSLYVRFPLHEREGESLVVWTTTPWTLPANVAAAVNPESEYGLRRNGEWVAVARYLGEEFSERKIGSEMVGWTYTGPFDDLVDVPHRVIPWDDVSMDEGTGIVHIAPGCGGEDFELSRVHDLDVITPVDESGRFYQEFGWLKGLSTVEAADQIVGYLGGKGLLVEAGLYQHRYPHCWRCDTPLIYKAVSSWFVEVTRLRDRMAELNEQIDWVPGHVKDGSFGKWVANAHDWSISRNRFWGSPIPVWKSDDPAYPRVDVYGSLADLERDFGVRPTDLHRPAVDELVRPNPDDPSGKSMMRRVPEVLDCWFESGSMPFAQVHYPFENADWFEKHYPGDFIVEYIGQTKGWFYTLHVMATALFD